VEAYLWMDNMIEGGGLEWLKQNFSFKEYERYNIIHLTKITFASIYFRY